MSGSPGARPATAVEFAIALLAARSWPEQKLHERLALRYEPGEVDAAMVRLRELGLVDDAVWAERFARDRFERGGKGRHRIERELLQRGIEASTVESTLTTVLGEGAEREKAVVVLAALRARLAAAPGPPARPPTGLAMNPPMNPPVASPMSPDDQRRSVEKQENRLFRRMLARGYPASLVRDLLGVS